MTSVRRSCIDMTNSPIGIICILFYLLSAWQLSASIVCTAIDFFPFFPLRRLHSVSNELRNHEEYVHRVVRMKHDWHINARKSFRTKIMICNSIIVLRCNSYLDFVFLSFCICYVFEGSVAHPIIMTTKSVHFIYFNFICIFIHLSLFLLSHAEMCTHKIKNCQAIIDVVRQTEYWMCRRVFRCTAKVNRYKFRVEHRFFFGIFRIYSIHQSRDSAPLYLIFLVVSSFFFFLSYSYDSSEAFICVCICLVARAEKSWEKATQERRQESDECLY